MAKKLTLEQSTKGKKRCCQKGMGAEEPCSLSPRLGTACAFDKNMNELAVFSKRHKEILAGVRAAWVGGAWQC